MKIYKGETGLSETWQDNFKPTMKCKTCGGNCRVMFVACEGEDDREQGGSFICNLHKNMVDGKYWVHDACAVAIYLCEGCFGINGEVNQA